MASHEANHAAKQQGTVDNGIEHFPKPADRLGHASDLTVEPVGRGGDGVDDECDIAVVIGNEEEEEDTGEDKARERNEVGDGEDLVRRVIGGADELLLDLFRILPAATRDSL